MDNVINNAFACYAPPPSLNDIAAANQLDGMDSLQGISGQANPALAKRRACG